MSTSDGDGDSSASEATLRREAEETRDRARRWAALVFDRVVVDRHAGAVLVLAHLLPGRLLPEELSRLGLPPCSADVYRQYVSLEDDEEGQEEEEGASARGGDKDAASGGEDEDEDESGTGDGRGRRGQQEKRRAENARRRREDEAHHFCLPLRGLDVDKLATENGAAVETAAFTLGMVYIGLMWTRFLCPYIIVKAGHLTPTQLAFWREHTIKANCEAFMEAAVDPRLELVCSAEAGLCATRLEARPELEGQRRVLVPMGFGKDSCLVWSLVERADGVDDARMFFLEDTAKELQGGWRYQALIHLCGESARPQLFVEGDYDVSKMYVAPPDAFPDEAFPGFMRSEGKRRRRRVPRVYMDDVAPFEHSQAPYAWMVAAAATLQAILHGYNYIVVGNERSANEGNTEYRGLTVNHQYDKSLVFERAFAAYIREHVAADVTYFSALMPLWDLQVAERFCAVPRYLPFFISCNVFRHEEQMDGGMRWCAACAKCAFVFAMLTAFLPPPDAWAVFGGDLYQRRGLDEEFARLLGLTKFKPLECVGSAEETKAACFLARRRYTEANLILPEFFRKFQTAIDEGERESERILADWGDGNLPAWFCVPSPDALRSSNA